MDCRYPAPGKVEMLHPISQDRFLLADSVWRYGFLAMLINDMASGISIC